MIKYQITGAKFLSEYNKVRLELKGSELAYFVSPKFVYSQLADDLMGNLHRKHLRAIVGATLTAEAEQVCEANNTYDSLVPNRDGEIVSFDVQEGTKTFLDLAHAGIEETDIDLIDDVDDKLDGRKSVNWLFNPADEQETTGRRQRRRVAPQSDKSTPQEQKVPSDEHTEFN